jgi:hypothetical protein
MGRSTVIGAAALALLVSSPAVGAAASTNDVLPSSAHAGRPTYDKGGWRCPPGFVWRNAGRTDWLCVDPGEARRIEQENLQAPKSWIELPDGTRACRAGLVTRDATKKDGVCVDPIRHELVREMNLALYTVR